MITQRDILETIEGLRQEARSLRAAAQTPPIPDMAEPVVVVNAAGLTATAAYLDDVASELAELIDNSKPVRIRK